MRPDGARVKTHHRAVVSVARYIGLDLHKDYIHGCEWIPLETRERHFRVKNDPDAWARLAEELGPDCEVAVEVTGNAFELYDVLSEHCAKVVLANPNALKRLGSGQHTDRVDAAHLAKMMAMNTIPAVWVPPQPVREVRRLLQYRFRLVQQEVRCKNQVKAVLRRYGCDARIGRTPDSVIQELNSLRVCPADKAVLISALRMLTSVEGERQAIEAEIARRLDEHPQAKVLLSIPGVGAITAAAIWAWLGEPNRFRTGKQVASYAGLDPSVHQSGETYYHGRISKNGNHLLRTLLIEAAQTLARYDRGQLGAFFRRKCLQIGAKRAIVALARKLVVLAWRMLQRGQTYRDQVPATTQRKQTALRRLSHRTTAWDEVAATLQACFLARTGSPQESVASSA